MVISMIFIHMIVMSISVIKFKFFFKKTVMRATFFIDKLHKKCYAE